MTTTRREFLIATVTGLGSAWLGVGCGDVFSKKKDDKEKDDKDPPDKKDRSEFPDTELDLADLVTSYFDGADLEDVRLIGRVYLQQFDSDDASVEDLSTIVAPIADLTDPEAAHALFDTRALEQFQAGDLFDVDGWQLAQSESRLCGLAYHLAG